MRRPKWRPGGPVERPQQVVAEVQVHETRQGRQKRDGLQLVVGQRQPSELDGEVACVEAKQGISGERQLHHQGERVPEGLAHVRHLVVA